MKSYKTKLLPLVLSAIALAGCTMFKPSFSTQVFRLQQTSENLVYVAYVGYTNYLSSHVIDGGTSNVIKEVRLKFAATDSLIDNLRMSYDTNSLVKDQLTAAVASLGDQASNVVWTIHYLTSTHQ
jgi:hypothetical protein